MPKPISVNLPYPDVSDIERDIKSANIISRAYAGKQSEMTAIMQYVYHSLYFQKERDNETADTILGIALSEMHHLSILGNLLLKLGVDPVFTSIPPYKFNFFNTSSVNYSTTPQKMLMDDVTSEILAIKDYAKIIEQLSNEKVSAIISRILLDEELHVKALKQSLLHYTKTKNTLL